MTMRSICFLSFIFSFGFFLTACLPKTDEDLTPFPTMGHSSLLGYDLTLSLDAFKERYSSEILNCTDEYATPPDEGYHTSKFKYPIKVCYLKGGLSVDFSDVFNPRYEIKMFKKEYHKAIFSMDKVISFFLDSAGKKLVVPDELGRTDGEIHRLTARAKMYKGIIYVQSRPFSENKKNRDLNTALLGRIIYINDQIEMKIQEELEKQKMKSGK